MEAEGQRTMSNPSTTLTSLLSKRGKLQEELRNIEKQLMEGFCTAVPRLSIAPGMCIKKPKSWKKCVNVHDLETSYLHDSSQSGHVLKGFEGFFSSSKSTANLKRSRKFQPEDRLFSLSSVTSPAAEEQIIGRDDGRGEYGPGRSKGGNLTANGLGKQKKGRMAPREGKRIRHSSEHDLDDEDDPEMSSR